MKTRFALALLALLPLLAHAQTNTTTVTWTLATPHWHRYV